LCHRSPLGANHRSRIDTEVDSGERPLCVNQFFSVSLYRAASVPITGREAAPIGSAANPATEESDEMEDGRSTVMLAPLPQEAADRREEERYPVSWQAEIFIPERTTMFRGRVVNISPSGCYVQTVAWVRVPPGTVVELVFLLDGRQNRVYAEARFAQSRTGVGLRFSPLEEEVRRRLDQVIASLSAAAAAEENADPDPRLEGEDVAEEVAVQRPM
jgi:hypothetical protein